MDASNQTYISLMRRFLTPLLAGAVVIGGLLAIPATSAQATTATIVVHVQGASIGADGTPSTPADVLNINGSDVSTYVGADDFGALAVTQATAGAPVTFAVGPKTYTAYDLATGTEIWLGSVCDVAVTKIT